MTWRYQDVGQVIALLKNISERVEVLEALALIDNAAKLGSGAADIHLDTIREQILQDRGPK